MSKRDELKKLRNAQKNTHSDDTPAEDYSKNAAEALETENEPSVQEEIAPEKEISVQAPVKQEPIIKKESISHSSDEIVSRKEREIATYSISNLPGKRISVSLKIDNKNWMHRTAMRCGLSIQDYVNILIEEAWEREKQNPYVGNDEDPLPERIPSNQTVLVAIKLSNENIDRSKRLRAAHYMTMTGYMNYLIEKEMEREKESGMRKAIFDD